LRFQFWRYSRPSELLALCLGPPKASPLLNDRALELGEHAKAAVPDIALDLSVIGST
jgi:hypothetical protein